MKLTKQQKEIVKSIAAGKVYDLLSYVTVFDLGKKVKLDKDKVEEKFRNDILPKKYYYPSNLLPKINNVYSENDYQKKIKDGDINPKSYKEIILKLNFNQGVKEERWKDAYYVIDFYSGVTIVETFNKIIDFLVIWEYLKSEMLILEVSNNFSKETLSLFYEENLNTSESSVAGSDEIKDYLKSIDFTNFTYGDSNYLDEPNYSLSEERCIICEKYFSRRIYATTRLLSYVQSNFITMEEKTRRSALIAAWMAVGTAIFLAILPNTKNREEYLEFISGNINDNNHLIEEILYDIDDIVERRLDLEIDNIYSELAEIKSILERTYDQNNNLIIDGEENDEP